MFYFPDLQRSKALADTELPKHVYIPVAGHSCDYSISAKGKPEYLLRGMCNASVELVSIKLLLQ